MDPATLKRLMIDDALDALPSDVSALLVAYTNERPADAAELSRWRQVTEFAGKLADSPRVEKLPPFPRQPIATLHLRRAALATAALAASMLLGFKLGDWKSARSHSVPVIPPAPIATVAAEPRPIVGVHDFWSTKRLLASALNQPERPKPEETHWPLFPANQRIGVVR